MTRNAMAYVLFPVLRGPYGKPDFQAKFYRSRSRRLHTAVGESGTLWVVTGMPAETGRNRYVLAYKLVDCELVPPEQAHHFLPLTEAAGVYIVRARDARRTYHFSLKPDRRADITPYLTGLRFTSGNPISEPSKTALRLRSFPVLTEESAVLLERLERKARYGRRIVISYAREDEAAARQIQSALEALGLTTYRDLTTLRIGENWIDALRQALEVADALLVLLSPHSISSLSVQAEVRWALQAVEQPGSLRSIVPLMLPGMSFETVNWEYFEAGTAKKLRDFNGCELPSQPGEAFFDHLARQIGEATEEFAAQQAGYAHDP